MHPALQGGLTQINHPPALNLLALSPHLVIPPIIGMTLNWPFESQLWHTGWVAYLQFSSWNLQLDSCQTPPDWPWASLSCCSPSEILLLTRAVNHDDTGAVAPSQTNVQFDLRQPTATAAIADLPSVKFADSGPIACTNTLCLPSGLLQLRSGWAIWKELHHRCQSKIQHILGLVFHYCNKNL